MNIRFNQAAAAVLSCLIPLTACGQSYPNKPIRLLVAFPPGGTSDLLARMLGQKIAESVGQHVIVDNRPGAGGHICAEFAARSAPDGYTLLFGTAFLTIGVSLYSKLKYDLVKDLAPITQAVNYTNLLVVHPSLPVKSVRELVTLAKSRPGQLDYGTPGNGTPPHMTGELFKTLAGVSIQHVPYKGGAPAITDLLGGQITILFDNVPPLLQHVRSGKMRALGVTSLARSPVLPDIPTIDEAGLKGFEAIAWNGPLAPAGTPREIITKLNAEFVRALALPDIRERLLAQGAEPVGGTPEQFAALIRAEIPKWAQVVKASGAKLD